MKQNQARHFTDSFAVGDRVAIIRTKHGWFDGSISGVIETLDDRCCTVRCTTSGYHKGLDFEINHVRDIRPLQR